MKTTVLSALLLTGLLANVGCSSKKDSNKMAEETNDKKVENASTTQAETMASDSKGNDKDVAEYMVALSNTGLSEYEMSKLAVERAKSPAVKEYARKAVAQHAVDEKKMKEEAVQYNITLPTTLSNDSQEMLTKLRDEKAGADFDKKYLDDMADINDKAISKAKSLVSNTDRPALKNFAQRIIADDQEHMDKAKKLKDAIK